MQVTANGIRIHYTLNGPAAAPAVTLSHSLATTLAMWEPQVRVLAERYRIVRFDTRGHGGTDAPPGPYTLAMLAADALALLDALGIQRTHFVGLSMGGMIGQVLALEHPDRLRSLSLCDTSSRIPPEAAPIWDERVRTAEAQGMEPVVQPTINRWFTPAFRDARPDVIETVRAMIRTTPPPGYVGCCQAIKPLNLTDRLGAIRVPTLVMVGAEDAGTPVAASRAIHEHITGSRLVIIPSASHLSNLEQPEAFNKALLDFLAETEPRV
ncbi:MAG TPA: 3-oxoadipate enol-lactonase [Candidatus Sulfotelmatobacter sp.]|nr:3-oxoadipate enol-lactonase [Candidatus Sulfotelmatobacter sp.]